VASLPAAERARLWIATGLGLGYSPFAPGTVGSLAALPLGFVLASRGAHWMIPLSCLISCILGWLSAGGAARSLGKSDPGAIVIDEVAGQLLALCFVPADWRYYLAAFLLFRLFDIWKPYPISRVEKWPGASGIMADDLLAGALALAVLHGGIALFSQRWG
jgi:phosphatidylglycerophosphatase A